MSTEKFKIEKVPPEGGWGYIIGVGMALPFVCALGSMPSFGLMFGDFLTSLGEETSAIALVTSSFFSAFSFAGLLTNTLFKRFSIRSVGIAGGSIYFLGSLMTVFVSSVEQLLFSFSILQGAGFGLMIPVAYTTFNAYFVNKRVLVMSIAQSLIGLGTMIYPIMVQFLMQTYGFRGSMAIIAAINSHSILGMLIMHPVQWHLKEIKVAINDPGEESLLISKKLSAGSTDIQIFVMNEEETEPRQMNVDNQLKRDRLDKQTRHSFKLSKTSDLLAVKNARSASLDPLQFEADFDKNKRRASSISSLGNWTGAVIVSDAANRQITSNGKKWQVVVDFLDLTLLNDPIYVNIVLGISFALYSDVAFFTLQPMYLFELGYTKAETAIIIATGAAADLFSRIFLAIFSLCIQIKARNVYLAGAIFTVIFRFVFLNVIDFNGMMIITAVMGFLRTWIHVPLPLVFAEYLPQERFPSGYGLFMFLQGNITFAIGPFIGWIRDVTKSYEFSFHCLTFIMALCAIPWLIEIIWQSIFSNKIKK